MIDGIRCRIEGFGFVLVLLGKIHMKLCAVVVSTTEIVGGVALIVRFQRIPLIGQIV
jgi:hypothetical protein